MTAHPTPTVPPLPHAAATPAQDAYAVALSAWLAAPSAQGWARVIEAWQRLEDGR